MLYLANPSRQPHVFPYRDPQDGLLKYLQIGDGKQEQIGDIWNAEQTRVVIRQAERYGARNRREAKGRMVKFNGLLWSDDQPISQEEIELGFEAAQQARDERARSEVVKAALGFDRALRPETNERPGVRATETTIEEETPRGSRPKKGAVKFNLTVDPEGRNDVTLPIN